MLDLLFVFIFVLSFIWYIISISHPKKFPPGPRMPLPLIGDGYKLGMVSHKMSIITIFGDKHLWQKFDQKIVIFN